MVRSSAKNHAFVTIVTDPAEYPALLAELEENDGATTLDFRRRMAAQAFSAAVDEATERYGSWDVAWGDVHRVRWGAVDAPVSGCPSYLGCFRHLAFESDDDGLLRAYSGDAWILAVEFDSIPRAYSILVFGQTGDSSSEHFDDQTEMFSRGELKPISFTQDEIEADLVRSYRPGW